MQICDNVCVCSPYKLSRLQGHVGGYIETLVEGTAALSDRTAAKAPCFSEYSIYLFSLACRGSKCSGSTREWHRKNVRGFHTAPASASLIPCTCASQDTPEHATGSNFAEKRHMKCVCKGSSTYKLSVAWSSPGSPAQECPGPGSSTVNVDSSALQPHIIP